MGRTLDDQVLDRARAGDETAWRQLVQTYLGLVYAICRGYGLRGKAAAEANQLVWLRLVENLPRLHTADAISGWIAATSRDECLRPRRSQGRTSWAATRVTCDGTGLVAAFLRIGVRCQRLLRLVATEPQPSVEDISAALDVAAKDVQPHCDRCLDKLGRILEIDGHTVMPDLRRIVAGDNRVPDGWEEAALMAFGWFRLDGRLAERVYDSLGSRPAAAAIGRATEVRRLRFAAGADGVELAFNAKDGEVMLAGQVQPAQATEVTARWPEGAEVVRTDEDGAFRFHGLPDAPLSVHVDGSSPLKTGWVVP